MGTEMTAFIEYDKTPYRWPDLHPDPRVEMPLPFDEASGEPYSVTEGRGMYTGSKDYLFFGAIAGVRNETEIPPLFPPRGLPANPCPEVRASLNSHGELGDHNGSWLRLSEINAALGHQRVDRNLLSFETNTILAIMENLVTRLGDEWVRLVFGFDS
jgi:hypothetical protein